MRILGVVRVVCFVALLLCGVRPAQSQDKPTPTEQLQSARKLIAQGKNAEAETILAKVVEAQPKSAAGWFHLGLARHGQGKLEAALEAHLKAATFPQVRPHALYNAGCVYARQKKTAQAIEHLEQAVAAGFADRVQLATDADLESIRSDKRFAGLLPPLLEGKDLFVEPTRLLHTFVGEGANHEFGWVARRVGDLDGDKVEDFVTTAPGFGNGAGKVYVYSSRQGKLLFARAGQPGQRLGNGAAGAGDVNGDGIRDVIVGGPLGETGVAEVLSGKDGAVIHLLRGSKTGGQFGHKVTGLGDINGDGHADFAVTALADDGQQPGSGRCYGYSGKDGKVLFTLDGEATGDKFGSTVAGNANPKHPMLVVGAPDAGKGKRGRVYVYHFAAGSPKLAFTVEAEPEGNEFGGMFLSFPGDLNGDGVPDVYASDFSDSAHARGAGRVFVFSGKDGQKLLDLKGTHAGEGFGTSPADAGDVNGDGVGDLVVGAWQNREKARSAGKVYLHSGKDGKLLTTWTCRQQDDTFGFDAIGIGDVDGDGTVDFLLTSAWSPARGPKTGRVFVVAGPRLSDGSKAPNGAGPGDAPAAPSRQPELVRQAQELSRVGKWAEAAAAWERVVQANPTRGEYWERLASAYLSAKEYRRAIPPYQQAIELKHGYPAVWAYNVACCFALLGEKDEAVRWVEKSLKMGYRYPRNAHTESRLASLRDDPRFRDLVYLADVDKMSRDEGFRFDLKVLSREIQRLHFNPYRKVTREQFEAQVKKLHDEIPKLTDEQVAVGFMKITCLAGDGHTAIRPSGPREVAPLQLFHFSDGVFVTAAGPDHADLAGAQVLNVGERPVAEVLAALEPVIHRDNAMGLKSLGPILLIYPKLLFGLGLIPSADQLPLTVRDAAGKERAVSLKPILLPVDRPFDPVAAKWALARKDATRPDPLTLKNRSAAYWFEYLADQKTVFFQFNAVRNDGKEPFKEFCERLFRCLDEKEVDRLVIDMRWNGGGNTFLVRPLIHGLIRCDKINQKGKLYVIIGRNTFSAAQNTVTDIEMNTQVTFVGEPTGSSPNFIGETIRFSLPHSKMDGSISDLWWQRSWPMDYRPWIAPELYAPPSFALFKDNRDPAMEAILGPPKAKAGR